IGAPHVFLNLDENLHVRKTSDDRFGQRKVEIVRDFLRQRGIGVAGDELYRLVLARHPEILALTPATGGVVITRRPRAATSAGCCCASGMAEWLRRRLAAGGRNRQGLRLRLRGGGRRPAEP